MSMYQEGRRFLDQQNFASAKKCFLEGTEAGDPKCAYGLVAAAAAAGEDCSPCLPGLKAVLPQLEAMAENRDGEACFIIARCYETGSAVEQDIPAAMKYYTRAAGQGNTDAMFNLGCIYMNLGPGGVKIAVDYFEQAAQMGNTDAQMALKHYHQTVNENG